MINLLYCGNLAMFDGIMLSLMSATKKSSVPVTAYIMTMDLRHLDQRYAPFEEAHINILDTVVKRDNPENSVILLDATAVFEEKMANSPNIASSYTPYAILRLFACRFDLPKKVLYVDTDIMFNKDISQIEDYDIEEYELAAVVDHLGKRFISKHYINTGVLFLNMDKIRQTELFERALDLCLSKEMIFPDQDAINQLVEYTLLLPREFNEQHKWKKDTIIHHFSKTIYFFPFFKVVNVKQWQIELVHKVLKVHAYDDIYQTFTEYREELGQELLPALQKYIPPTCRQQLRYSFKELKTYLSQNGGIFRKKKKTKSS